MAGCRWRSAAATQTGMYMSSHVWATEGWRENHDRLSADDRIKPFTSLALWDSPSVRRVSAALSASASLRSPVLTTQNPHQPITSLQLTAPTNQWASRKQQHTLQQQSLWTAIRLCPISWQWLWKRKEVTKIPHRQIRPVRTQRRRTTTTMRYTDRFTLYHTVWGAQQCQAVSPDCLQKSHDKHWPQHRGHWLKKLQQS